MGILDEAIREHLELKRQHGAGDSELKQIEDEAFGPPARPDEFAEQQPVPDAEAEAPTTHMAAAEAEAAPPTAEAPPVAPPDSVEPSAAEPELPAAPEPLPPPPSEEEHPAIEHEIVSEATAPEAIPEPEAAPPPEAPAEEAERRAIADEPTQHFDVLEGEVVSREEETGEGPLDQGFEVEEAEAEPLADSDEEEAEFFDEKSLSDELDQALDAPPEESTAPPEEPPAAEEPAVEEAPPEPPAEEEEEAADEGGFYNQDEDVLEETPEFLQDTPESDRLWFEQKPPKDFDFDD